MEFTYVAINNSGEKQKGKIEANSEKEIIQFLKVNNLTPITVKRASQTNISFISYFNRIRGSDIVIFTRQLSSMIQTGLTLIESLNILKKQTNNPELLKVIDDLIENISEGKSFSEALSEHKSVFSEVYISLMKAAEKGGLLDKMLERLADDLEKADDLNKRVKSAFFYPAIVVIAMIIVVIIMQVAIIPQLSQLYDTMGLELPFLTKVVLTTSKMSVNFLPLFIVLMICSFPVYRRFKKTEPGIKIIDKIKIHLPVIGSIIKLSILSRTSRTISLLITAGTSILETLTITSNTANNYYYRNALVDSSTLVQKGVLLSSALEKQNVFPEIVIQMAKVGEETGKLDDSFLRVSEYFERDLDIKIKTLTTAVEPILIVMLGVGVGFLIISVITPIYSLISQFK